jgi:benzodiazapine receptor
VSAGSKPPVRSSPRGGGLGSAAVFLGAVALTAFVASRFRPGAWYAALDKPSWTPPDWVFAPVWTLLYASIAFAGWLLWRRSSRRFTPALGVWVAQLVANGAWSWIFFGLHRPGAALADILVLLALVAAFIALTIRSSPASAALFVPYAPWVAFAAALNAAVWIANRPVVS